MIAGCRWLAAIMAAVCVGACAESPADDPPRATVAAVRRAMDGLSREGLAGRELYERYCGVCHGPSGGGDGFNADRLPTPPPPIAARAEQLGERGLRLHLDRGAVGAFAASACPPYGANLSSGERRILAGYLLKFGTSVDEEE